MWNKNYSYKIVKNNTSFYICHWLLLRSLCVCKTLTYCPLTTWCKVLTHWKIPWCLERLQVGGERDDRGWGGWMASLTQWTWVWVNSGSWWWTGRPGMLQSMESQRVRHDWVTELNWRILLSFSYRAGLVVMDSFSFSLSGSVLNFPLCLCISNKTNVILCSATSYLCMNRKMVYL